MLLAQLRKQGLAALVAPSPSPSPHNIHILHGCCTSVAEVVRMERVRIHSDLARSEQVVDKMTCMVRASGVGRHACAQQDIHTRLNRLEEVHAARRNGSEEANKDVSGPAQRRTPVAFGVCSNDPLETLDLYCAL
jgi:hypothetical protein